MCFSELDSCYMTFKVIEVPLYSSLNFNIITNKTQHSRIPLLLNIQLQSSDGQDSQNAKALTKASSSASIASPGAESGKS